MRLVAASVRVSGGVQIACGARRVAQRGIRLESTSRRKDLELRAKASDAEEADPERDLEAEVEAFMKQQAEQEGSFAAVKAPEKILGAEIVSDDDAKAMCKNVLFVLRTLMEKRDMTVNEVKLIIQIEDPRQKERRQMGIEDSSGISRDELAFAFEEVVAGRMPNDRIALKVLEEEMRNWPFLEVEGTPSEDVDAMSIRAFEEKKGSDASNAGYRQGQAVPPVGRDPTEAKEGLADMLPDWVGYGVLYGVSVIPLLIAGGAVFILFINSLQ